MSDNTSTAVTASTVRTWATENGADAGGSRGRLPSETVAAYNAANPEALYAPAPKRPTKVKVSAMRVSDSGRKVPIRKSVVPAEAREWANENGYALGARGRVPTEVMQAFVLSGYDK